MKSINASASLKNINQPKSYHNSLVVKYALKIISESFNNDFLTILTSSLHHMTAPPDYTRTLMDA